MSRLYLVRHGEAAAGWSTDLDPGLSERGRAQAESVAVALAPLGPLSIITSPLRRTRETAAPLAAAWGIEPQVDEAVGEIPSPTNDLAERGEWLARLFALSWDDWPDDVQAWRGRIPSTLAAIDAQGSAVIFTHYVFIGLAVGDPAYQPDYCSVTVFDGLRVVARGDVRETRVL